MSRFRILTFSISSATMLGAADTPNPTEPVHELDKIVVTASPFGRSVDELAESVTVLAGPALQQQRAPSLGETLAGAPGVTSTYFGPGASRPLIRGLGAERIRILTNGLGSADVAGTSPDHAVSLDPALLERIEILRGPAALLYGSSAVGGLVNVVERNLPTEEPAGIVGLVDLSYGTGAEERAGLLRVESAAQDLAWQISLQRHRSDDVSIPGFAEAEPDADEEHAAGTLENSAIDTRSGSAGASWFWRNGFSGLAFSVLDSRYGVPGHEHAEEEAEGEADEEHAGVQIDLQQRRFDWRAEITEPFSVFRSARLRFAMADYRHLELEGEEIGTRFDSDSWEGRIDLLHQPLGGLTGAIGAQASHVRLGAAGEEAFLPPTRTQSHALFAVEEFDAGSVRWQFGARWEAQDIAVRDASGDGADEDGLSGSGGVVWTLPREWTLAMSLARTERAPTAQELFADGPHAATRAFEIGDPMLPRERSTGLDVTLRRRAGIVTGALTVFVNDFANFIFEEDTGEEEDGLSVYRYVAQDARFTGAEFEATWHLHEMGAKGLELTFSADTVRATNRTTRDPLPRIPATRAGVALSYEGERWSGSAEVRHTAGQARVAPLESASEGYTLCSLYAAYRVPVGESSLQLYARVANLTDTEARPHTSFLKDVAPLPGRNVTIGARWEF